jgi:solute carrier family 25 phosphate transporter 23/24/25/41
MVSEADVTSRFNKFADQEPPEGSSQGMGQGNTAYCQTSPLYVDGKDGAAGKFVSLAQEAKIATEDVKVPTSNAILSVCKSLVAGGVAGGV